MNRVKCKTVLLVSCGLLAAGAAFQFLLPKQAAAAQPWQLVEKNRSLAHSGLSLGLLGGFRSLTANIFWLRAYSHWKESDAVATRTNLDWALALASEKTTFWLNAAQIVAYDFSNWEIERRVRESGFVPQTVQEAIRTRYTDEALELLRRARQAHPNTPDFPIEMAGIYANKRGDFATAAVLYREAALLPEAPYYAARLHAEMLRRIGRHREAYNWLVQLLPKLPADDPRAQRAAVIERIRDLERQLDVPPALRLRAR